MPPGRAGGASALRVAGVGNPLPGLETGAWAQQQVAALLPRLQAIDADAHLLPLPADLPAAERPAAAEWRDELLKRWQRTLGRLAAIATMKRDDLVRTGRFYVDLLMLPPLPETRSIGCRSSAAGRFRRSAPPSSDAAEAEGTARAFAGATRSDLLFTHDATAPALWARLPGATWLHLACHGRFDVAEPLDSALLLAEGTQIAGDLLASESAAALAAIRLAFLCLPDRHHRLPLAGRRSHRPARCIFAGRHPRRGRHGLWPVNDRSTALPVTRFYELLPASMTLPFVSRRSAPSTPLRLAQQWLAKSTTPRWRPSRPPQGS
ncbi:MAG: CHAT domain-containing protein [Caldilinea sp.]|nr:CHAT domain-containing protein [Caldilinea sp.]